MVERCVLPSVYSPKCNQKALTELGLNAGIGRLSVKMSENGCVLPIEVGFYSRWRFVVKMGWLGRARF